MDPQEYIESGILEQYALGELSEVERAEVERQAAAHPLIRQEMNTVLEALAAYATQQESPAPPAGMRERVLSGWQAAIRAQPEAAPTPAPETIVRPLVPAMREESAGFNWLMAASVALLLLSAAANFVYYSRWQQMQRMTWPLPAAKRVRRASPQTIAGSREARGPARRGRASCKCCAAPEYKPRSPGWHSEPTLLRPAPACSSTNADHAPRVSRRAGACPPCPPASSTSSGPSTRASPLTRAR